MTHTLSRARRVLTCRFASPAKDAALPITFVAAGASIMPGLAAAQEGLEIASNVSTAVQTTLLTVGPILVVAAVAYAGVKLLWTSAAWQDVKNVFWGGVILGSAVAFGGWLISVSGGGGAPGGGGVI